MLFRSRREFAAGASRGKASRDRAAIERGCGTVSSRAATVDGEPATGFFGRGSGSFACGFRGSFSDSAVKQWAEEFHVARRLKYSAVD